MVQLTLNTYIFVCQSDICCCTIASVKDSVTDHQIPVLHYCIVGNLLGHKQVGLSSKGCGCCRNKDQKNGLREKREGEEWRGAVAVRAVY